MVVRGRRSEIFCRHDPSRSIPAAVCYPLARKTYSRIFANSLYPWTLSPEFCPGDRRNSSILIFDYLSKFPALDSADAVAVGGSKQRSAV